MYLPLYIDMTNLIKTFQHKQLAVSFDKQFIQNKYLVLTFYKLTNYFFSCVEILTEKLTNK